MNVTDQDYENAIQLFVNELQCLEGDLVSCLLWGSYARGTHVPGKSDLDFIVILNPELRQDKQRFFQALDAMLRATQAIEQTPVPAKDMPQYYFADELEWFTFPNNLFHIQDPSQCRVVAGKDVRPFFDSSPSQKRQALTSYIKARFLVIHPLTRFLGKEHWSREDQFVLGMLFARMRGGTHLAACRALGGESPGEDPVEALQRLVPEIDHSFFGRLNPLYRLADYNEAIEEFKQVIRDCAIWGEAIHDRILQGRPDNLDPVYLAGQPLKSLEAETPR